MGMATSKRTYVTQTDDELLHDLPLWRREQLYSPQSIYCCARRDRDLTIIDGVVTSLMTLEEYEQCDKTDENGVYLS